MTFKTNWFVLSDLKLSVLILEPGLLGFEKWFGGLIGKPDGARLCISISIVLLIRAGILYCLKSCCLGVFRHGGLSLAKPFCATYRSSQKIHHVKPIQLTLIEHNWN